MENKPVINILYLILFFDMFVYVLFYARKIAKHHIETSAIEDKFIFTIIFSCLIKCMCYVGLLIHIKAKYFNTLYYAGDFGLLIVALLLGLVCHQKVKNKIREAK